MLNFARIDPERLDIFRPLSGLLYRQAGAGERSRRFGITPRGGTELIWPNSPHAEGNGLEDLVRLEFNPRARAARVRESPEALGPRHVVQGGRPNKLGLLWLAPASIS